MGDVVLLTGPMRDLREAFPQAQISFWGGSSATPLACQVFSFQEVHELDFKKPWRAIRQLRSWSADVTIDAGQWSRAEALISGMSGGRFVIGFETPNQHRHRLYDAAVAHRGDRHELENFRALLDPLGVVAKSDPSIGSIENPENQHPILKPYVVFHMWPSGVTHVALKQWPKEHWRDLTETCLERGRRVALTGGMKDMEFAREWMMQFDGEERIKNVAGVSVAQTIAILQNAEAVVSVNTGVMHLAAALGVPTIGLHGPTNSKRWGPVGSSALALEVPPPEGGYLNLGFEYPVDANSRKGTETISAQDVLQALSQLIPDFHATGRLEIPELMEV